MNRHLLTFFVISLLIGGCSYLSTRPGPQGERSFAGALRQVSRQPQSERQAFLDNLVRDRALPVCEGEECFFLYKAKPKHTVRVAGDWNGWNPRVDVMKPIRGTRYYLLKKRFPSDARLDYKIIDDDQWLLDPLNPRTCEGGAGPNSELAMPGYVEPEELLPHPDIHHGVVEEMVFKSTILDGTRTISVYLPPGYGRVSSSHPFLIVHDGSDYVRLARFPDVADVLIAEKKVRPLVLVFVDPRDRDEEYGRSEKYLRFTVEELIPYLRAQYELGRNAEDCGVLGVSLGGFAAFRLAWRYPEVIGKMAGQSSYFGTDESLFEAIKNSPAKPIQLYLDVGRFEQDGAATPLGQNRRMRDLLGAKGYVLTYAEHNEGHSWGNWRAHVDDILTAFWPRIPV